MARTAPVLVFLLVFAFMFWLVGHRLILSSNDEGIYLDAGRRVAEGQSPFLDFFYLSGPGTPWAMGLSMKLFGVNLPAARLLLMFDLSLMAALVFWMTRRLAASSPGAALVAAFLFVGFSTAQPAVVLPNHRWDSGALALAAIVLTWLCREQARWWQAALAGLSIAAAVWMTPSMALLALALSAWFILDRPLRPRAVFFVAAGFVGLLAGVLRLHSDGALIAMIDQLYWIGRNYSGANRMAYGQVIGGYGAILKDSIGVQPAVFLLLLFIFTIPAWLPIAATLGWLARLRRTWSGAGPLRFQIPFLLTCGTVLIAAQAPRMDLPHLMFASPVYYALGVSLVALSFAGALRTALALAFLLPGGAWAGYACLTRLNEQAILTRTGVASMNPDEVRWLRTIESHVQRGDALFAFPYMPVFYFALDGRNPTRYCFLQPGMSSVTDEASVLADLRRHPPQWVIYTSLKPEDYLRIWPSSDRTRLRMDSIESFIAEGYRDVTQAGPYTLKRRR